jgi:drug/metabolite transporter (DMT)-like permease
LAALLCAASFLVWLFALQRSGAAHVAAIRNVSVLFATLLGWAQGEPRTARSLAAGVCIALGALCISW